MFLTIQSLVFLNFCHDKLFFTIKKLATAFQLNDMAVCLNGATVQTSTAITALPTGIDRISIGCQSYAGPGNGNYFTGHIRKLAYYPERLTNTQTQVMTVI